MIKARTDEKGVLPNSIAPTGWRFYNQKRSVFFCLFLPEHCPFNVTDSDVLIFQQHTQYLGPYPEDRKTIGQVGTVNGTGGAKSRSPRVLNAFLKKLCVSS